MSKKIETQSKVTYTCDQCGCSVQENNGWYQMEFFDDIGVRVFEEIKKTKSVETKIYAKRKNLDFCTKECAKEYNLSDFEVFLQELTPIENRSGSKPL